MDNQIFIFIIITAILAIILIVTGLILLSNKPKPNNGEQVILTISNLGNGRTLKLTQLKASPFMRQVTYIYLNVLPVGIYKLYYVLAPESITLGQSRPFFEFDANTGKFALPPLNAGNYNLAVGYVDATGQETDYFGLSSPAIMNISVE